MSNHELSIVILILWILLTLQILTLSFQIGRALRSHRKVIEHVEANVSQINVQLQLLMVGRTDFPTHEDIAWPITSGYDHRGRPTYEDQMDSVREAERPDREL